MAELLKKNQSSLGSFKKGEIVPGVITKLTSSEILVNINAKAEALVLEKEKRLLQTLLSSLKVGDSVTVQILNPESDMGYPVVSLRRFMESSQWEKLESLQKNKEVLEVTIDEITKGGFIASSKDGVLGFLPNSHVSFSLEPQNLVGNKLKVVILELDRPTHRVIFSQKQTTDVKDFENEVKNLKVGQKLKAHIINVAPFGIFASVILENEKAVEGFVHISEVSWENVVDLSTKFSAGDEIEMSFIGIDKDARRINLSIKRLSGDPFEGLAKDYPVDKKVSGTVSKIISSGLIIELGGGISGIIKKEKIPPTVSFKEGDLVEAVVSGVDERARRITLVPVLKEKPIGYR